MRPRRDAGFSLVETVITIGLIGLTIGAIVVSLLGLVTSSKLHRDQAGMDAMLRSSAEVVLSQGTSYVDCATPSSYAGALPVDPVGQITVEIADVAVWNGAIPPTFGSSCTVDSGASRITIRATAGDGTTEELAIIKRRSA